MGVVGALADAINTREDGLRLLLTILAGYPLALIHRSFFVKQSPTVQHIFFVIAGVSLYFFNCGTAIYHSLLSTLFAYLITNFIGGKTESIIAAHVAFLGHMLVGYWFAESDQYDITWTTPFCIMVIRYIGLVMDVYDGHNYESAKPDQKLTGIRDKPSLLEIAAFGYFFAGTFVGPQFTLQRFRSFVNGEFLDEKKEVRASGMMPSLGRFVAGVAYMVIHQWGAVWIPAPDYFHSQEYLNLSFLWRWTWVAIWFRLTMYRYCAAWLITEGAAILAGISYNGKDENGEDKWDGTRDLHIGKWELGMDYTSVVESFNVGTNTFAKNHLFRRMRWMNSKMGAQFATLMYLAIWHGYHLGYFLLFIFEMACMLAQEQFYTIIKRLPSLRSLLDQPWTHPFKILFGRIVMTYSMGFAFLTFGLIKKEIWWGPVKSLYFVGFIIYFLVWPILFQVLIRVLPREKKAKVEGENTSKSATPSEKKKEL
ncbi:mboa-6 [Pristionchus pacificus]|uniref:Lysophospholipid acyltransferase 5 n=1 Tax=Pristionchus pacificus TaxID=54126 RepID=A0A2A6CZ90_PRIPA|nr:mboa-6 [Pristionchus pacificus]|eukprot:PDM83377.1 mboa-6 [Pristionchus pacificus]